MSQRHVLLVVSALPILVAITVCQFGGCLPENDNAPGTCALTITIVGNGMVNLNPPNVDIRPDSAAMSQGYDCGESVTLTATADAGWEFHHWDGDVQSFDNPLSVTASTGLRITAVFLTEGMSDLFAAVAPPDGQPLEPGSWSGMVTAARITTSEGDTECPSDDGESLLTATASEDNSIKAAATVGPTMDLSFQQPVRGEMAVVMDESYHHVDSHYSTQCCANPPDCTQERTVTPGQLFDYLELKTASASFPIATDSSVNKFEIVINFMPVGGMDDPQAVLEMLQWIRPYEDRTMDVVILVTIMPETEVFWTERNVDKVTHPCEGTTDNSDESSEGGELYCGLHFYEIPGRLIKRSDGRHEIVGSYENKTIEDGHYQPCGPNFPREITEECVVHLIRTP